MRTPSLLTLVGLAAVIGSGHAEPFTDQQLNEDTTTELQNEEQVVINPTNPNNLVAAWRDFRLGYRQVGWGYTFDGGETWTNPGLIEDVHYSRDSDPALTVNAQGDFFAMLLAYNGDTSQPNGMLMFRSQDGGVTWEDRGFAVNQVPGVFEDKQFIACDRTGGTYHDRIYMAWDRFNETNIYVVSTGDDGDTWTSERRVSDNSGNQFPIPVVLSDGTVVVAWTYFFGPSIRIDRSFDGGLTFGSDNTVTSLTDPQPNLNGGISAPAHPAMDCDITGGTYDNRLYCAYIDRNGSSGYDIFVRYSDDRGVSWSSRTRVNDDATGFNRDQFHPWLTVDNTGTVTIVWLDRRADPGNCAWYPYMSQSTDGGVTWSANQQLSSAPSTWCGSPEARLAQLDADRADAIRAEKGETHRRVMLPGELRELTEHPIEIEPEYAHLIDQDQRRAGAIGEYIGVAAYDGYATPVWTDFRAGHQDVWAALDDARTTVAVGGADAVTTPMLEIGPNPARGPVALRYQLPEDGRVRIAVYDVSGRKVRTIVDRKIRAGSHDFVWDLTSQLGAQVAPGAYYVRYEATGIDESRSVLVQR